MNAIETQKLSKAYGRRTIVRDLDLTVPHGIVFGYLGPNGAGKTTTIRMLTGVLAPTRGGGTVAGADLRQPDEVKARIGYANQAASVYGDLSVEDNLAFKAALYLHPRDVQAAVERTLDRLGLVPWRRHLAGQLSGGWRQRVSIGTAVVHGPSVLFLDEPTAGLDPVGRRDLWDAIYALTEEGTTVFVTTHYMDEAERCQRLAMIASGTVLAQGTPRELRDEVQGRFLELDAPDLPRALRAARTLPGVRGAWIVGTSLRLSTEDTFDTTRLHGLGTSRETPATLEDVFVTLSTRHSQEVQA